MMYILSVFFIDILAGIELDIYTPSFPELQSYFSINTVLVELTLGINFIAHCVSALVVGNLADKYGRKLIINIGLSIFILGSVFCVFASNYYILLIGRLLQGIGISGPSVLAYVLIVDRYPKRRAQHLTGINNAIITIAMALAPLAGSYISSYFGWRGNFLILLIMGFIALILVHFFIIDEYSKRSESLTFDGFMPIFKSTKSMLYLITISFACQAYWIFIAMSPILYMNDLKVDILQFGFYQGFIAAVFAFVSLISNKLTEKFGAVRCFIVSVFLVVLFFFVVSWAVICDIKSPFVITSIMALQAVCMAYPLYILWPLATTSIPGANARLSALLVNFRFLITAILVELVSFFYSGNFVSIGIAINVVLVICLATGYILHKKYKILEEL